MNLKMLFLLAAVSVISLRPPISTASISVYYPDEAYYTCSWDCDPCNLGTQIHFTWGNVVVPLYMDILRIEYEWYSSNCDHDYYSHNIQVLVNGNAIESFTTYQPGNWTARENTYQVGAYLLHDGTDQIRIQLTDTPGNEEDIYAFRNVHFEFPDPPASSTPVPPTPTPWVSPTSTPTPAEVQIIDGPHCTPYCTSCIFTFETNCESYGDLRYKLDSPPSNEFDYNHIEEIIPGTEHELILYDPPAEEPHIIYYWVCASATQGFSSDCAPSETWISPDICATHHNCSDYQPPKWVSPPRQIASSADSIYIEWITNEGSGAKAYYGPSAGSFTERGSWPGFAPYHIAMISRGLLPNHWHTLVMQTWDNEYNYDDPFIGTNLFKTADHHHSEPPVLLGLPTCRLEEGEVIVDFATDEYCRYDFWYASAPDCNYWVRSSNVYSDHHTVSIDNLQPDNDYTYRLVLTDLYGNIKDTGPECWDLCNYYSDSDKSKTRNECQLVVGPSAHYISDRTAIIWWQTNQDCVGLVKFRPYGSGESYSSSSDSGIRVVHRSINHYVVLSLPLPSTTYEYRLVSGGIEDPGLYDFTSVSSTDQTNPTIISEPLVCLAGDRALVWWKTDEYSDGVVKYLGSPPQYGVINTELAHGPVHTVVLSHLTVGSPTHFEVISRDIAGNCSDASDQIFTPSNDGNPPQFIAIPSLAGTERCYTEISWVTNEPCTSSIEYGTDVTYDSNIHQNEWYTDHSVTLCDLLPSTKYYFSIQIRDFAGNTEEYTFDAEIPDCATPTPTLSPTQSASETPVPSPTQYPSVTPTPSSTPTFSPTATQLPCLELEVNVTFNTERVSFGEVLSCDAQVCNPNIIDTVQFVAMLDIGLGTGEYWFFPSWRRYPPDFDSETRNLSIGITEISIIQPFNWPDTGTDALSGITIYSAILNNEMTILLSTLGHASFGYGP